MVLVTACDLMRKLWNSHKHLSNAMTINVAITYTYRTSRRPRGRRGAMVGQSRPLLCPLMNRITKAGDLHTIAHIRQMT